MFAPTLQDETGVEKTFYHHLYNLLQQADSKDKLLVVGDLNARMGRDFELCKGVLGRHGIGNCDDNWCLLLEYSSDHQLHPRVTAAAPKRSRSFCQKCTWQVTPKHPYTHDTTKSEWADYAIQAYCGNLSGNELTRNSSAKTWLQSSQLAEPVWTDPGLKSGITVRELISTSKKKKKACEERMVEHSPKILASEEKSHRYFNYTK